MGSRFTRRALAGIALLALSAAGACGKGGDADAAAFRGVALAAPLVRPPVVLTTTAGAPFDFIKETEGRVALVFFGYTHCPDVCPLHLANIAAVLRTMSFDEREKVRMIFVTVDPERDTPEVLRKYLDQFDRSFIGIVGPPAAVTTLQQALRVGPARRETVPGADTTNYFVAHGAQVTAFSTDGVAHLLYPFGIRQDDWAHDLPRLVRGEAVPAPQITVETVTTPATAPRFFRAGSIVVSNVVVTVPPVPDRTAMYFVIRNDGDAPDTLRTVLTDVAASAAIHRDDAAGGMAAMVPVPALVIGPHQTVRLAPGALHAMLMGLQRSLTAGMPVAASLVFARAGVVTVRATVVPYASLDSALGGPAGGGR